MEFSAEPTDLKAIVRWRDIYRLEMACQIIHDSVHEREGWTDEYMLFSAGTAVGYGSVAVGGPWKVTPAVYEFYVVPHQRLHLFLPKTRTLEKNFDRFASARDSWTV